MFLEINQSETRIACAGPVCKRMGTKWAIFIEDHRWFLPNFGSFSPAVSEEKTGLNRPIRNKNCLWRPRLLMDRDNMSNLYRGPSIDTSYQVSVHLANVLQRRRLKCEKLTDDGRQMTDDRRCTVDDRRRTPHDRRRTTDDERRTPSVGKSSRCLRQGELKRNANAQYRKR